MVSHNEGGVFPLLSLFFSVVFFSVGGLLFLCRGATFLCRGATAQMCEKSLAAASVNHHLHITGVMTYEAWKGTLDTRMHCESENAKVWCRED